MTIDPIKDGESVAENWQEYLQAIDEMIKEERGKDGGYLTDFCEY